LTDTDIFAQTRVEHMRYLLVNPLLQKRYPQVYPCGI